MPEITEEELLAKNNVVKLMDDMLKNPKTRAQAQALVKQVRPDAVIPEHDAKTEVLAEIAKEREARIALEKKIQDAEEAAAASAKTREFQNSWDAQKSRLARDGWMPEGIASIERLASERGIADLEAAAALYEKMQPPPAPVAPNVFGNADLLGGNDEKQKALMTRLFDSKGEDEGALAELVNTAILEVRQPVQHRGWRQ